MMKNVSTIDEYIALYPTKVQAKLSQIRAAIKSVAPQAQEAIRYGMPTFRLNNTNLIHFAAFKTHFGIYPTPTGVAQFAKDLSPYSTDKGTWRIPLDDVLPLDLIKNITSFRVKEVQTKNGK